MFIIVNNFNNLFFLLCYIRYFIINWGLGIGDWGLGNPQSPIPNPHYYYYYNTIILL